LLTSLIPLTDLATLFAAETENRSSRRLLSRNPGCGLLVGKASMDGLESDSRLWPPDRRRA
jgi:hypothetical protein